MGELIILNLLLDRSPEAWCVWVGPLGDRHDFRKDRLSLEVKSSTRLSSRTITISSVEQLEPPPGGELFLANLILERVPSGELTVASLYGRAAGKASDPNELLRRIHRSGCADPASEEWNRHSFELAAQTVYRVGDTFPRLVPSMVRGGQLPAGIVALTYEIEIAVLQRHAVNTMEFAELMRRFAQ